MKKKLKSLLNNIVFFVFNILFAYIFLLLFVVDAKNNGITLSNLVMVSYGIVITWLMYIVYKNVFGHRLYQLSEKQFRVMIYLLFALLFAVQCIISYGIYFQTRWDVEVLRNASDVLAKGNKMQDFPFYGYFLVCYNNVFLTTVFTVIKRIFAYIPFISGEQALVFISILCVNFAGFFTVASVDVLFRKRGLTIFTYIVFSLFLGISPWMIIPYSDTYTILFTILIFYLYITRKNSRHLRLRWLLLCLCTGIGFLIKPTCIIIFVAICMVELWNWLFISRKDKIRQLQIIPIMLFAFFLVICLKNAAYTYIGFEKDVDRAEPLTHFAMMGLNPTTNGTYFGEDVEYTTSFPTHDEKVAGNIKMIKKRLKEYGFAGYYRFLCIKTLINYNDGTFSWGLGGDFFGYASLDGGNAFQRKLKSLFYNQGKNYGKLSCMQHSIWITLLFMMIFLLKRKKWEGYSADLIVAVMTIIGITLFTMIFEARARYLFLYAPIFIILGISGLHEVINRKTPSSCRWGKCCNRKQAEKVKRV